MLEEKVEAGEPLSVAESYVFFGLLSDDVRYRDYDVEQLVHDEVMSRLGPHSL
jgi:hypothetical protein